MKILILIALFILVLPVEAAALHFKDGNELYSDCLEGKKLVEGQSFSAIKAGGCFGYIVGVWDGLRVLEAVTPYERCTPESMRIGQLVDVVTKYLEDHPEERHEPGDMLIIKAVTMAWPCPNEPKTGN